MVKISKQQVGEFSELEYRRRWVCQLRSEFRLVCSWYKIELAVPAFKINDSRNTLGSWDRETRTITISSFLINGYSWDGVINVLKHEMAHQYVHEYMGRTMEHPHGPSFTEACERLGVPLPFSSATGDTPQVFTAPDGHDSDPEYDSRMDKVRKMLSLAGSTNENEAATAMSKANSFIRKYNLERIERDNEPSRYGYEIKNTGKKRLNVIERRVASLLMDYFYVDIVYSDLFDPERTETLKTIELLGSRENVAFASHVYDFLMQRVDYLWKGYRKSAGAPGRLRKTYILGLLQGFREKLAREEKKETSSSPISAKAGNYNTISVLVVTTDPGLSRFVAKRFPRLRKVQYVSPGIHCSDTYSAGKSEGRKITVHRAVEQEDGNLGRLLDC